MMNLDARTVALAQDARVRAHSGREPASGKSGGTADVFELIFRRLKDQAAPSGPAPGDSPSPAISDPSRDHSIPTPRWEARAAMPGPAPQNGTGSKNGGHSAPAQDLLLGGAIAQARDLVADAAVRLAGVGSAGETLEATSDAVLRPAATMTVPLARETALDSLSDAVLRPATTMTVPLARETALDSLGVVAVTEQPLIAVTERSVPEAPMSVLVDKSGAVAQSGAEPIVFAGEAWEAAPRGDTTTRFMPAMSPEMSRNHGVSMSEAVAEPHVAAPQVAFHTSARFFEALVARGGAVLDGGETAGGTVVDKLVEATGGGALSHLTSPPTLEHAAAPTTAQAPGIGRAQLIDQVVQTVRMAQSNEATEIIVQLKPEFLGRLSIRVLADEHGMRVEIRAENQVVRQVMQDNLADLQQRLSEKGMAFDQFSVFAEAGSHSGREPAQSFHAPENGSTIAAQAASEAGLAETVTSAHSAVLDYFA